jgi:hypothetical protein
MKKGVKPVKDEMWKHNGRSWVSLSCDDISSPDKPRTPTLVPISGVLAIQVCVSFIMFMEEFAYLVLNTIFLFSQLTQLEQINRRNTFLPSLFL